MDLVRTKKRWVGGVLGGIAQFFGINPDLLRLIFILAIVFTVNVIPGLLIFFYVVSWIIIPSEEEMK